MKINIKNEDLVIEDESRAQNTTNSTRCFCNPVIDGIKDKNILIVTHTINASVLELLAKNIEIDYDNPLHLRNFKNGEIKSFIIK